jgi:hypothetical protein
MYRNPYVRVFGEKKIGLSHASSNQVYHKLQRDFILKIYREWIRIQYGILVSGRRMDEWTIFQIHRLTIYEQRDCNMRLNCTLRSKLRSPWFFVETFPVMRLWEEFRTTFIFIETPIFAKICAFEVSQTALLSGSEGALRCCVSDCLQISWIEWFRDRAQFNRMGRLG